MQKKKALLRDQKEKEETSMFHANEARAHWIQVNQQCFSIVQVRQLDFFVLTIPQRKRRQELFRGHFSFNILRYVAVLRVAAKTETQKASGKSTLTYAGKDKTIAL